MQLLNIDKLTYAGNLSAVAEVADDSLYAFTQLDICDRDALNKAVLRFAPDAVIHLAAESHVDRSLDAPINFIETNVVGTFNLLEAALQHWQRLDRQAKSRFRFIHVSTDEVYGSLELNSEAQFDEQSRYAPNSPYAASKASADHLARAWFRSFDLPVIVSNCSNNYGPYQFPDKLIPRTIIAALEGREVPVYGSGENVRDWLYVDDHVLALELLLTRGTPGETYLIGGGAERRNIDLVQTLCAVLDNLVSQSRHRPHAELIALVADRPGHDLRYSVNDTAIRLKLGWGPQETLETGLEKTVSWYVENRNWWEQLRPRYSGERLGLALSRSPALP